MFDRFLGAALLCAVPFALAACAPHEVEGTYFQDWAQMEAAAVAAIAEMPQLARLDEAARGSALELARTKMRERVGRSDFRLVLDEDGRFYVTSRQAGSDPMTASGTWELEGERLTMTTTHEDGAPASEPDVRVATLAGDAIRLRPDASFPFDLVLSRR